jgi:type II secretory pathway pseudopilin PulG
VNVVRALRSSGNGPLPKGPTLWSTQGGRAVGRRRWTVGTMLARDRLPLSTGCVAGRRRGLSLIELVVIIVVVGLISAAAIPTFASLVERAGKTAPAIELEKALANALAISRFDSRTYPTPTDVQIALDETYDAAAAGIGAQASDSWQVCAPGDPGYPSCPLDPSRTGRAMYEETGEVVGVALVSSQCVMGRVESGQVAAWPTDNQCNGEAALAGTGSGFGQAGALVSWGMTDQPLFWQSSFEGQANGAQLTNRAQVDTHIVQAYHRTLGFQPSSAYGDLVTFSATRAKSGTSSLFIKGDADRNRTLILNFSCTGGQQHGTPGVSCASSNPRPDDVYVSMYVYLVGSQGTAVQRFASMTGGAYSTPAYSHIQSLYADVGRTGFRSLYGTSYLTGGSTTWVTGQWMRIDYEWHRSGTARIRTFWGDTLDSANPGDAKSDSGVIPSSGTHAAGLFYLGALDFAPDQEYYLDDVKVSKTPIWVPDAGN